MSTPSGKLWAPWRSKIFEQPRSSRCIFCTKPRSRRDKRNYIVYRSTRAYSMLNLYPYNNGHVLVAPYRHVADWHGLNDAELNAMIQQSKLMTKALKKLLKPDGFNIGINMGKMAGAAFDRHIHIHVVPRWLNDTNFMLSTNNTKIVSQSLDALYLKLRSLKELSP